MRLNFGIAQAKVAQEISVCSLSMLCHFCFYKFCGRCAVNALMFFDAGR